MWHGSQHFPRKPNLSPGSEKPLCELGLHHPQVTPCYSRSDSPNPFSSPPFPARLPTQPGGRAKVSYVRAEPCAQSPGQLYRASLEHCQSDVPSQIFILRATCLSPQPTQPPWLSLQKATRKMKTKFLCNLHNYFLSLLCTVQWIETSLSDRKSVV